MNHIFNLCLIVTCLLIVFTSKADQLTITFTNPVPVAPINCNDTWSEQGVEMEITNDCYFDYGNGYIDLYHGILKIDLSNVGIVNKISFSILNTCYEIGFKYYDGNDLIYTEYLDNENNGNLIIYEFENINSAWIEFLNIILSDCNKVTLFDLTIDYNPICETEPISNVRNGDVYLNDACYGVIMTSASGNCFRTKVADSGMLFTEPVECP